MLASPLRRSKSGRYRREMDDMPESSAMTRLDGRAPSAARDDIIEIVTGRDGGARHQQQHFLERIHNAPRLAVCRAPCVGD
jgi:hypothetical protein